MQVPMRRSVTFASHPQLDDASHSMHDVCLPTADLLNLRLVHQQATETKTSIMNKIRGIFIRSSSNKESSNSLNNNNSNDLNSNNGINIPPQTGSIKAALKCHMGMITKFIPTGETSASCNALYNNNTSSNNLKSNLTKSGNNLNQNETMIETLSINKKFTTSLTSTSNKDDDDDDNDNDYMKLPSETRVSFLLPSSSRRPSFVITTEKTSQIHQQPTLRERIKGSPRFPHRIIPTCSLSALEEKEKGNHKMLQQTIGFSSGGRSLGCVSTSSKWNKSIESSNNTNNGNFKLSQSSHLPPQPLTSFTSTVETQDEQEIIVEQTKLQSEKNNSLSNSSNDDNSNNNESSQTYAVLESIS